MSTEKRISMNIQDGIDFFAHETSINFSPAQFIIDFKNITPRVDPRSSQNQVLVLRHNVVLLEPIHAKKLSKLLADMVKKYEKEFGKIEKSKTQIKYEKKLKRHSKNKQKSTPTYLG